MTMTFEEVIQEEAEKYHDGRENDPNYRQMMEKLFRMAQRAKGNRIPKAEKAVQTDFGYEFSK